MIFKRILRKNIVLIILIILFSNLSYSQKKNILIIHSYHKGLEWTDDITEGIESTFSRCKDSILLWYEYLDAKKWVDSIDYYSVFADIYARKYKNNISVIIISDNTALEFILKFRNKFAFNVPIVFCGINDFKDDMLIDKEGITGIVENVDYKGNIDLILKFHPYVDSIIVINDNKSTTSKIHKNLFIKALEGHKSVKFIYWEDLTIDDIEQKAGALNNNVAIFLINYHFDKNNEYIDYKELAERTTKNDRVPVYAPFTFFYGKGIVGGLLTSGKVQGEIVANMAKDILKGKPIKDIPVIKESPNRYMFDYTKLKHFKISNDLIPLNSFIINKTKEEESSYSQRKDYAILFGCDLYEDVNWVDLKNPVKDARTIAEELQKKYGFYTEVIENPTLDTMSSAIKKYCRKHYNPEDQLFIFFSGHGYFDKDEKEGYIVVKNSIYGENSNSSYYNYSKLLSQIDKIECRHIFLVVDVCFAGALFKDVAMTKSDGMSEIELRKVSNSKRISQEDTILSRGVIEVKVSDSKDIGFIEEVLKYKTRKALTSGGIEEVSDGIIHSNFAYKFIEALRTGCGDDGILTTSQIKKICESQKPSPLLQDFAPSEPGNDFLFIAK